MPEDPMSKSSSAVAFNLSRRALVRDIASLTALSWLGATSSATHAADAPQTGRARPGTITTALSWIPNNSFAGMWVALDRGYFDEVSVKVDWRPGGPNTPNPVERVSSGEVILGQQANPRPVLEAIVRGNDFVIVGSRYQRQPGGLLSLAKNPVLEPKDIVGKRILGPTPTDAKTIETALRANRLPIDFKFVPGGADPQALLDGQGDAMVAFVTNQTVALELKGLVKDKDFFHRTWDELGLPGYNTLLFLPRRWLDENRDLAIRYLRAEIRGWKENERDPMLGARLAVDKYGVDFGLDLKREFRSNQLQIPFLHSDDTRVNGLFWISRDHLGGPVYEALRLGGVERLPDVDKILDMSVLKEANRG
jgi:ABC-type nitrate/sulfonate/bicarbonate transport system substrate-binding protein